MHFRQTSKQRTDILMPTKLLIAAVTLNAVFGQLLLKRALAMLGGREALTISSKFLLSAATSPWILGSLIIQLLGYILWIVLISREKLGVATASVGAGFYILMPLCAWALYGESLTNLQWFGICMITIGVTCVSLNTV
jgi:drug/metabolite transporter (DMT)-like permease